MNTPIKIGIIGVGHLGKIHLKQLSKNEHVKVIGLFDTDPKSALENSQFFKIKSFDNADDLIHSVDAIDIVTPTIHHFKYAKKAIQKGKHIFIEKPITYTLEEASYLIKMIEKVPSVKVQVGHVERFNPAFLSVKEKGLNPLFIEAHRLAIFNPRGTDVSVILDLMIHDIDIILSLVKSNVKRISASGVAIVKKEPDIANARIEFDNGTVANLTASRLSLKNMRKMRIFQQNAYISIDFLEKKSQIFKLSENKQSNLDFKIDMGNQEEKFIHFETPIVEDINSIAKELNFFIQSILEDTTPVVSIIDGYEALKIAYTIKEQIEHHCHL